MEILVCVKRVPDPAENEIGLNDAKNDVNKDDFVYSINEFDNYAVEEAIQIVDKVGGSATVLTIGESDDEEVLRRELAMGAGKAVLISDETFKNSDGRGIANILKSYVAKNKFDLILTGAQADNGCAEVGGMLAAFLDLPFASLVNKIEVLNDKALKIGREIEGGRQELNEISLPCVLSIQTGINEPRYVSIKGIRQASSIDIPVLSAKDIEVSADSVGEKAAKVKRLNYFEPELGKGAEILEGSDEETAIKLVELLKAKGGIK